MNESELKALEAAAYFFQSVPNYLINNEGKKALEKAMIEAIDALDIVEFSRTKNSFLALIQKEIPYHRKRAILSIAEEYGLTDREGHALRYLANGRNPTYIAEALSISVATARSHKYSIYRKLGIHSKDELEKLLLLHGATTSQFLVEEPKSPSTRKRTNG